jgi:hypothetical protein
VPAELRISIACDAGFRRPACYSLATLALIAGWRARFVDADADVHYGPAPRPPAAWLPASAQAPLLLGRSPLRPDIGEIETHGIRILNLFPVPADARPASDIVAASFFFLSLHEEWTSTRRDQFGRFQAADSLLGKRGELDRPAVAEYARVFERVMRDHGRSAAYRERYAGKKAAAVMTHDIDYLSKFTPGLLFRELAKNFLLNRRHVSVPERWTRLREYLSFAGRERDPYIVSIARMLEEERRRGIVSSWLFKAGGNDKRDVSYGLASVRARETLSLLRDAGHDIGLHPSFNTPADPAMLAREVRRLRQAAGLDPVSVRQHYLRLAYPATWRQLAAEGFIADSTLGFAEREGFRNGVCHPFLPWDLEAGAPIRIWELPLTVMDGTLAHYRGMETGAARLRIAALLDIVAEHEGTAVLLFHNTSYDAHDFPGWGGVFEDAARRMSDGRFLTAPLSEIPGTWLASADYASTDEFLQVINSVPVE